ncbi:hypothetical protein EV426DRAFT_591546 [Tirmania nivea]|nr:hypothetical protein EV426DRAFT_591546 [Tirmania nivea]
MVNATAKGKDGQSRGPSLPNYFFFLSFLVTQFFVSEPVHLSHPHGGQVQGLLVLPVSPYAVFLFFLFCFTRHVFLPFKG